MKNVHTLALLLGKMSDNKIVLNFRFTIYKHTKKISSTINSMDLDCYLANKSK